jgi:hypothetical protein
MSRNHHIDKATQRPQLIAHVLSGSAKPETRNQLLGLGHRSGNGRVITPTDGRHSTLRAFSHSIDDKLTMPFPQLALWLPAQMN